MKKLNPKQKKIAAAAAIGGVLALFVLLRRKSGGAQTQDATANPASGTGLPADYGAGAAGGTFADNGASAGQLTSAVADLSSGIVAFQDTVTGQLTAQQQAFADAQEAFKQQLADLRNSTPAPQSAPGPAGDSGQPAGNAGSTALAKGGGTPAAAKGGNPWAGQSGIGYRAPAQTGPNVFVQGSGSRAGQTYKVIQKKGADGKQHSYRDYGSGAPVLIK